MNFREKLRGITQENNSLLCVGLDIDSEKIPDFLFKNSNDPYFEFNKSIIDATKDIVCAYKLNMAFYEVLGIEGFILLEKTINYIPKNILIILDGKRNDIGNTAKKYAKAFFETFNADAITINPYLGKDGIVPFLDYKDKCSFILCRTSNPSAGDFQDLNFANKPLFSIVATKIKEWNIFDNCGAVVGATYPNELKIIRKKLGDNIPLLVPGIGKQGGDISTTVKYGTNKKKEMAIINSSRGIIYASDDKDFADSARKSALLLKNEINLYR
ncbi:MAG: orotidine-5'-phosphate decarboxylase [Candidatus Thermoplasmatota archaeon]|nr:orotidine-5'-phosphate decarboxylase [Candidatus Thermoplasmatota archaeon]